MHLEALTFLAQHRPRFVHSVLDLGSGEAGEGRVRDLFPDCRYIGLDHAPGRGVDHICDIQDLPSWPPLPMGFDVVICAEVLEHATLPGLILANAWWMLREGGTFLLTAAAIGRAPHSCIRPGPPLPQEHYANVDPSVLYHQVERVGFRDIFMDEDLTHHDVYLKAVK